MSSALYKLPHWRKIASLTMSAYMPESPYLALEPLVTTSATVDACITTCGAPPSSMISAEPQYAIWFGLECLKPSP